MSPGSERRMYLGGNTALGFFSYYDYVAPADAHRIMIIKGGPGVGKSTMMKWLGRELQARGYDVEYFHCSSDNSSLDGIRVPELEAAVIDGTAPHVVDPKNPGVVDEILHLGEFWDEAGIRTHRESVLATSAEARRAFQRAYRFLAAAKHVYDDTAAANQVNLSQGLANEMAEALIAGIFGHQPVSRHTGWARHLFASAITPSGPENHLSNLMDGLPRKYVITGSPGTGRSALIERVVDAAVERGHYIEAYHCGFDPRRYEHVLIPGIGCAVITSTYPHLYEKATATVLDMDTCRDAAAVSAHAGLIAENTRLFHQLLRRAISFLAMAKSLHDRLEEYYIPYMDFRRMEAMRARVLERILQSTPARN